MTPNLTCDVVALPLELALEEAKKAGLEPVILKTYPTKSENLVDRWRVVRQSFEEGKLHLVVAQECAGIVP